MAFFDQLAGEVRVLYLVLVAGHGGDGLRTRQSPPQATVSSYSPTACWLTGHFRMAQIHQHCTFMVGAGGVVRAVAHGHHAWGGVRGELGRDGLGLNRTTVYTAVMCLGRGRAAVQQSAPPSNQTPTLPPTPSHTHTHTSAGGAAG